VESPAFRIGLEVHDIAVDFPWDDLHLRPAATPSGIGPNTARASSPDLVTTLVLFEAGAQKMSPFHRVTARQRRPVAGSRRRYKGKKKDNTGGSNNSVLHHPSQTV
jgi:hypothetical protein